MVVFLFKYFIKLLNKENEEMTTAHRPTWNTAKGGSEQGGNVLINPSRAYSSKDMPSHTSLKERVSG